MSGEQMILAALGLLLLVLGGWLILKRHDAAKPGQPMLFGQFRGTSRSPWWWVWVVAGIFSISIGAIARFGYQQFFVLLPSTMFGGLLIRYGVEKRQGKPIRGINEGRPGVVAGIGIALVAIGLVLVAMAVVFEEHLTS